MKAEMFTQQSLRSFQALPLGGHDILLCLCTCVRLKTCNSNLQQAAVTVAGIARTHKITSGITNSASVTRSCTVALPSIFSSLTSLLVSSQSRSLLQLSNFLCLSLLPISWQVFFSSSVVCFGPLVLCLSVLLFHAFHISHQSFTSLCFFIVSQSFGFRLKLLFARKLRFSTSSSSLS